MVYLSDDHPLEIVGRGNIKIKLDDGTEGKFCDVQHVSSLQKNLFSIKMMDKMGYSTTFGDNRCKISKGTLVVEKGKSYGTLYRLCGDTITKHAKKRE